MKPTCQQRVRLDVKPTLSQMIVQSNLIALPEQAFDSFVDAILQEPGEVERVLTEQGKNQHPVYNDEKVKVIFALRNAKGDYQRTSGLISIPDLQGLESSVAKAIEGCDLQPDICYTGRENQKPEISFAEYFYRPMRLAILHIDRDKYKRTAGLFDAIRKFDDWRMGLLRDAYMAFGDAHREFFECFDPTKLRIIDQSDLGAQLGVSSSIVSKIVSNRYVEAVNLDGEKRHFATKVLCVTRDEMKRYAVLDKLNGVLEEEFKAGRALSDFEIAERLGIVARRTVAQYRTDGGIPSAYERNEKYRTGTMNGPYQFDLFRFFSPALSSPRR